MKFLVCISNVPDTTTKITFTENNTKLNTSGVQYILNPYDELALARALELAPTQNADVTVMHVGRASAEPTIRKALAIGADSGIRIDADPNDSIYVAAQIAAAAGTTYDLIFFGRESIDFNGADICSLVGAMLEIPSVSVVKNLEISSGKALLEREIEGGKEVLESRLPLAVSCSEGIAEAKIPNMRGIMSARTKPLTVVNAVEYIHGSTTVGYEAPLPRGQVIKIDAESAGDLIVRLRESAKVI